jgi:diguanylate cyclase (GGDEF)-like protein
MNKKIIYKFSIVSSIIVLLIALFVLYSFKNNNIKLVVHNAENIANIVKSGLTSHMINGNMNQVDTFINSVSSTQSIEQLWLIRGDLVNNQFGKVEKRAARDSIDEEVLKTGQTKYQLNENFIKTTMRITIPYKVSLQGGIDCTKCHNASMSDTLGAISLEFDMSDLKQISLGDFYFIPIFLMIGFMILLLVFRNTLNQSAFMLENFTKNLTLAITGNFEKINYPKNLSLDMVTLIEKFNRLMTSLKDTSSDIDKKLNGFIGRVSGTENNSLEDSKQIVSSLTNLYQFKKEIEQDNTKDEIYNRLAEVLINQFKIKDFRFIEINTLKKKIEVIKEEGDSFYCKNHLEENPDLCRAVRTKNDVMSIDFHSSCSFFTQKEKFYYCLDTQITKNVNLVINFVFNTKQELESLKDKISFIKSYINESVPSIEVKFLMQALQESAFTDGLTGLYNRKFLEEHSKKLIAQAKRESFNIGILLLDMDHFKSVNDEYGHDIGDKVLKELSKILVETVRDSDIIIRYGGEEFIILLVNVKTQEDALAVADKIRMRVKENEIDIGSGTKLRKTISIGLSMFPEDSNDFDNVIKDADIALYEAKNNGRDKVVKFEPEVHLNK